MTTDANLDELERDIHLLEELLDRVVRDLWGEESMALLTGLHENAVALRRGTLEGGRELLAERIAALDLEQIELLARTVTQWFHLINAAEEQHRVRVLRRRQRPDDPMVESVAAALATLERHGYDADTVQSLLDRLFIMPVLTAHPTEARRRTVLDHLGMIADTLDRLDKCQLHAEEHNLHERLRAAVTALHGTEESRSRKPTPSDEIRAGLDIFHRTLLDATPRLYRAVEEALAVAYPDAEIEVPAFLRWGTWIGGDRDGNPFVKAAVTRTALERQRRMVIHRYLDDVQQLLRYLSVSERLVGDRAALAELDESIARDRERLPDVATRARRYTPGEPWREKLWYVRERLQATLHRDDHFYPRVEDYVDDLRLLERSITAAGYETLAGAELRDARRRAEVFGFHLASMDLRQHSAVHERAVAEILAARGIDGYREMDEPERQRVLDELLSSGDIGLVQRRWSAETAEVLDTLDMVGRARREQGPLACQRYIISFTSAPSDMLEVLFLVRAARLSPGELRPVPLLEQLEDLQRAGEIAERMFELVPIRAALRGELEVMIGYSDAGKQVGYVASQVALRRAQQELVKVADRHGALLTIFHGRGGAVGRGGGPANRAIRAQPAQALRGRVRITEQGETITYRYNRLDIAVRDLEQMVSAVLLAVLDEPGPRLAEKEDRDRLMAGAAAAAQQSYAQLIGDRDRLARYAVAATPILQVSKLQIGSRPASRKPGFAFEDLRAIPWVFSWNQSRHGIPGWFGLGSALDAMVEAEGIERARELYRTWPFFRAMINNAQLSLTRADIDVAAHYARLAPPDTAEVFRLIAAEHQRTMSRVLEVVDRQQLLGNRPHLVRSVLRRNPHVDLLSHSQIELIRRVRAARSSEDADRILSILFVTINGIAAGLQTAG